jgi:hypothetical protein
MSREDVVAVALRLFALFLLISVVRFVGTGAVQPPGAETSAGSMLGWLLLASTPVLAFAAFLWFFPLTVASKLLPVMREPRPALRADAIEVEGIAFTLLGLWLLAGAISDAIYYATFLLVVSRMDAPPWDVTPPETVAGLISTGAQLLIGVWLLLGSRGLMHVLRRWRYAGSAPVVATAVEEQQPAGARESD